MKITKDSHLDHNLSEEVIAFICDKFAGRDQFFIERVEIPEEFGTVPCALYGPLMGDSPVMEEEVSYAPRGNRAYPSRMINRPMRKVSYITVIAGPHNGDACILYTAFGGPLSEKEVLDPTVTEDGKQKSIDFWSEHALSSEE